MRTAAPAKIFGVHVAVDPKLLLGGLVLLAAVIFWYNSRSASELSTSNTPTFHRAKPLAMGAVAKGSGSSPRRKSDADFRPALKYRMVDGSQGDIDPRLRLDLLARLRRLPEPSKTRSLFEVVSAPVPEIKGPILIPRPLPPAPLPQLPVSIADPTPPTIPLKYYGFIKSAGLGKADKGFFLDGDVVLIGVQGDLLEQRYKLITLTAASAELQDIESSKSQTLAAPQDNKQ